LKIAVLGRTEMLLYAARTLAAAGHAIVFIGTAKASPESLAKEDDFAALASEFGCTFHRGSVNEAAVGAALVAAAPDLGVTMNWPGMFGHEIVNTFPRGLVNAHGSDLPKYRGNACANWAILNGEREVGLTLHFVDPAGLDTGPVVTKRFMALEDNTYIADVYAWLRVAVPEAFVDAARLLADENFEPVPQNQGGVIRAYPRRPEDGRIDWRNPAETIHRLIRASGRPFAGAFCRFENEVRVVVHKADVVSLPFEHLAVSGQVLEYRGEHPLIACGSGALLLTEIEAEAPISLSLRARFT